MIMCLWVYVSGILLNTQDILDEDRMWIIWLDVDDIMLSTYKTLGEDRLWLYVL